ncbi:MAG: acetate kinase [Candidatus Omnitrophota bacterium]
MNILVINSGSSSIKYELFDMPKEKSLCRGMVEHIGEKGAKIKNHYSGLKKILDRVSLVEGLGHRIVHGGEKFKEPALINKKVISGIRACIKLAPLHNPANLEGVLAAERLLGNKIPQVAVFDTAFFAGLPVSAYIYGLPYEFYKKFGIRRYGFHGTSHEYVARTASLILKKPFERMKMITCHLGNGCSITAIKGGRAIDTSMGFTPLEGLVMGTRCGDIDPAIITFLIQSKGWDIKKIDWILNKQSGLKGISGISNDMRRLNAEAKKGNKRAKLAIDIFVYRIRKYISAYLGIMGGCDAIVFTGGIGENQSALLRRVYSGLFVNLKIRPRVMVIPTQEELMIARKSYGIIRGLSKTSNLSQRPLITQIKLDYTDFSRRKFNLYDKY